MRSARIWTLAAAAALTVLAPLQAVAQDEAAVPTVGVLDFTGLMMGASGNSAPLGKAVSTMLITELIGRDGIRVIERQDMRRILEEQTLALSGRVDESSAVEIGKLLGAQYMVFGQVTSIADQLRLDMRAVDVETSEVLEVQKISGATQDLLDAVVRLADSFADNLDLPAPDSRPEAEEIPVMATIEFSRAVDYEDKGDTDAALEHYQKALDIHPTHRDAQRALTRLQGGGE